jgi:hypothetical protein
VTVVWRNDPPTADDLADANIIGWAFRGELSPNDRRRYHPDATRGVLLEIVVPDRSKPSYVRFRQWLFPYEEVKGQWCPIYAEAK